MQPASPTSPRRKRFLQNSAVFRVILNFLPLAVVIFSNPRRACFFWRADFCLKIPPIIILRQSFRFPARSWHGNRFVFTHQPGRERDERPGRGWQRRGLRGPELPEPGFGVGSTGRRRGPAPKYRSPEFMSPGPRPPHGRPRLNRDRRPRPRTIDPSRRHHPPRWDDGPDFLPASRIGPPDAGCFFSWSLDFDQATRADLRSRLGFQLWHDGQTGTTPPARGATRDDAGEHESEWTKTAINFTSVIVRKVFGA